ncbi:MAG: hypothetical protein ACTTM3_00210 [Candidatus Karelsulcia muelleri]
MKTTLVLLFKLAASVNITSSFLFALLLCTCKFWTRPFDVPIIFKSKATTEEAFELSYYGASIIHINTLHPLKKKKITLYVRSFFFPKKKGTLIKKKKQINFKNSFFILKKKTILLSFFIKKKLNISEIFNFFSKIKILLIQYSSISLTVCLEDKFNNIMNIILNLKNKFIIKKINNVELYTIIHYKKYNEKNFFKKKKIILRQINFDTAQWVLNKNI